MLVLSSTKRLTRVAAEQIRAILIELDRVVWKEVEVDAEDCYAVIPDGDGFAVAITDADPTMQL